MKKVLFALAIITLFSCGKNEEEIQNTFEALKVNIKEMKSENILSMIDEDSKNYFREVENQLRNKSEYKLEELGEKYKCPLKTRLLFQVLEQPDSVSVEERSIEELLLISQIIGMGILNPSNMDRIFFKNVEEVNNNTATAIIRIRTQPNSNTFITTKYIFTKEEDKWKINLPSTFGFDEKILNMQWKRSGGAARTFIEEYIDSDNKQEAIQFQYRK